MLQFRSDIELHRNDFGLLLTRCDYADHDDRNEHHGRDDSDYDFLFPTQGHSLIPYIVGDFQILEVLSTWKLIKQFHVRANHERAILQTLNDGIS